MSRPFLYKKRLHGKQANEFFGEEGTEYTIRLGKLENNSLLIIE